jgi:hypothetical protein
MHCIIYYAYICAMKLKGYNYRKVKIYHQILDLEYEHNSSFFLITEIVDGQPQTSYYYRIPDNYKDNSLLGELHEKYALYCPN